MRFSEQEIALIFQIVGLLFILGLGYLVFRHWFDHLRGYRSRPASFDPAETMAELIRLAPNEAEIIPLQDAGEAEGIGMAPFIKWKGELLCRRGRFFVGYLKEAQGRLLNKGETITVAFDQQGISHVLTGRIVARKRLSRKMRRITNVSTTICYAVVPIGPLQRQDDRGIRRHCLDDEAGKEGESNPYLLLQAYLHRMIQPLQDGAELPAEIEQIITEPYQGTYGWDRPSKISAVVAALHEDLRQRDDASVWVSKVSGEGGLAPLGYMRVLGVQGRKPGRGIMLERKGESEVEDWLLIGYTVDGREKECLGHIVRRKRGFYQLRPQGLPREQGGYPARVLDFSSTGLRLEAEIDLLDYLLPEVAVADDPDTAFEKLENQSVVLDFYPEFRFPSKAKEVQPLVPGKFQLVGRIVWSRYVEKENGPYMCLGLHFICESNAYDNRTGLPFTWTLLRGHRESEIFQEIHQSLDRLQGFLQANEMARTD